MLDAPTTSLLDVTVDDETFRGAIGENASGMIHGLLERLSPGSTETIADAIARGYQVELRIGLAPETFAVVTVGDLEVARMDWVEPSH